MLENTKQTATYYQSMDTAKAMETNTPPNKNLPLSSMQRNLKIVTKHAKPYKMWAPEEED
jgi:hypothetical protein